MKLVNAITRLLEGKFSKFELDSGKFIKTISTLSGISKISDKQEQAIVDSHFDVNDALGSGDEDKVLGELKTVRQKYRVLGNKTKNKKDAKVLHTIADQVDSIMSTIKG